MEEVTFIIGSNECKLKGDRKKKVFSNDLAGGSIPYPGTDAVCNSRTAFIA
jgi:hypothetical protein